MAAQYSYENTYTSPEFEYQAQETRKKLKYMVANFAQVRFRSLIKSQMYSEEI